MPHEVNLLPGQKEKLQKENIFLRIKIWIMGIRKTRIFIHPLQVNEDREIPYKCNTPKPESFYVPVVS